MLQCSFPSPIGPQDPGYLSAYTVYVQAHLGIQICDQPYGFQPCTYVTIVPQQPGLSRVLNLVLFPISRSQIIPLHQLSPPNNISQNLINFVKCKVFLLTQKSCVYYPQWKLNTQNANLNCFMGNYSLRELFPKKSVVQCFQKRHY